MKRVRETRQAVSIDIRAKRAAAATRSTRPPAGSDAAGRSSCSTPLAVKRKTCCSTRRSLRSMPPPSPGSEPLLERPLPPTDKLRRLLKTKAPWDA